MADVDKAFNVGYIISGNVNILAKDKKSAMKLFDEWVERGIGSDSSHIEIVKKLEIKGD